MSRIRTIKPEFWTDEKIVELPAFARLLFIGIWNFCDDDGRMVYSPKRMKMQIFPADELDITNLFAELERQKLVQIYTVNGVAYLQVTSFSKHQKIDKRSASKHPTPPSSKEHSSLSMNSPDLQSVTSHPTEFPRIPPMEGKGMERKGKDSEANASVATATLPTSNQLSKDELWAAGKSLLQEAGMPAKQCGSFVGKLAKEYGNEVTIEAVRTAVFERPADPVAYLKATCLHLVGQRKRAVPWYATDEGVLEKAKEVGLSPNRGESTSEFKLRIESAIAGKPRVSSAPVPVLVKHDEPERVVVSPEVKMQRSAMLRMSLKKVSV